MDEHERRVRERRAPPKSPIEQLDEAFKSIERPVTDLAHEARRTKRFLHELTAVVVLEVVFLFALVGVAIQAHNAAFTARKALTATCEAGNDFRKLDLQRWLFVLDLAENDPQPALTAEERRAARARAAMFRDFIVKADALRVCR